MTRHHRFLLRLHLQQIDALNDAIVKIDREVGDGIAPFRTAIEQISTIPGVKDLSARNPLRDRHRHDPLCEDAHLISWACICPRK